MFNWHKFKSSQHLLIAVIGVSLIFSAAKSTAERAKKKPSSYIPSDLLSSDGIKKDRVIPLVDFENIDGWEISNENAEASFSLSNKYPLWGKTTGRLVYRRTENGVSRIKLSPPAPMKIRKPFNSVQCWIWNDTWSWQSSPRRAAKIKISAIFHTNSSEKFKVTLSARPWKGWFLCYIKLTDKQIKMTRRGTLFAGFEIEGKLNNKDNVLLFDNFAVIDADHSKALKFKARARRGINMLPGQSAGLNTGSGRLPFPTREKTILPTNSCKQFTNKIKLKGNSILADYKGENISLCWKVDFKKGPFSGIAVRVEDETDWIEPCGQGGIWLNVNGKPEYPTKQKLIYAQKKGDFISTKWMLQKGKVSSLAEFRYRIWDKSLVVDLIAPDGKVSEVRYGSISGLKSPKLIVLPYYTYKGQGKPAIVLFKGKSGKSLFFSGNTDWYLSNASLLRAKNSIKNDKVFYNFGTQYYPVSSGKRNGCFERLFLTVAPTLNDVMPTIPNPVSPWKHITGTKIWRSYGASANREKDYKFWSKMHRFGIHEMIVVDHESMWTDLHRNPGSSTFVANAAPDKGGNEAQKRYSEFMQKKLGYRYGLYNQFADLTTLNKHWNPDHVSWKRNNQLLTTWDRCYGPKPAYILDVADKLLPKIQSKFNFSAAYCDVHTCWTPSERVDYDSRVPGAGTAAAAFYAYGELFLLEKKAFNGPVYSEGGIHYQYCGLTDGNYAQDSYYDLNNNPWIVDFDLRKMHDLCCNFGMGYEDMFYHKGGAWGKNTAEWDRIVDRFLCATIAFGHPGYLVLRPSGALQYTFRSYFMLQQIQSRYTQTSVQEIFYIDDKGKPQSTNYALPSGAYKRSQVAVRYSDGTCVVANGHKKERLESELFGRKISLPPNGYTAWTEDGKIHVFSGDDANGHRYDYAVSPAYIYIDTRGKEIKLPKVACKGVGICRRLKKGGKWEVIPLKNSNPAFAVDAISAEALDYNRKSLGFAKIEKRDGYIHITPVKGAFSYILQ